MCYFFLQNSTFNKIHIYNKTLKKLNLIIIQCYYVNVDRKFYAEHFDEVSAISETIY